ncbi:TonB-dependent receptor [Parapedobacter deserti]|uniref:TonB-dependent receptor n=1 Tax=Parapedobacter deserti TaxID=1912957 RepID=A0ABV7JPZ2_9SPHI
MKVTVFLTFACMQLAIAGHGQHVSINVENAAVTEVLYQLSKQSGYDFIYDAKLLEDVGAVTLQASNRPFKEVLSRCFEGHSLEFVFNQDNTIVIRKGPAHNRDKVPLQMRISGAVRDSLGSPLEGVSVLLQGTSRGTVTDVNGTFQIQAKPGQVLTLRALGYLTQEVIVGSQQHIQVVMQPELSDLDEVVVVGYGVQEKVNLTGAVGVASGERLEKRPIASVGEGLQGVIPNLNIAPRNGDPAEPIAFNIRGFTSINGGEPLILVDGVPMDINRINPSDIESVSVLKDAAAAAVYGARAAFGVILVTTKGAKAGKVNVDFNTQLSLAKPIFNMDPITDPYEFVMAKNAATQRSGGNNWYSEVYVNAAKAYSEGTGPEWIVDNGSLIYVGFNDYHNKIMTKFAPTQQHDLSVSGGSESSRFFVSLGHMNKDGYLRSKRNENFKRYNVLMKADFKITNWLSIDQKITFNSQQSDKPHFYNWDVNINSLARVDPIMPIQFPDLPYYLEPGDREKYEPYIGMYFGGTNFFPYLQHGGRATFTNNDTWLTQGVSLEPLKNLKVRADFSYNFFNRNFQDVASKVSVVSTDLTAANMLSAGYSGDDWINEVNNFNRYYVFNAYAEYNLQTVSGHRVTAMAGFNQEAGRNKMIRARARSLITPTVPDINTTTGAQETYGNSSHVALRGAFYRINYNYRDRYLLETNGRYDGTSRFPRESRYGFFPSISLGWRIDNEGFMASARSWLNNLKIRASYGSLGNQLLGTNYYPYIAAMGIGQSPYMFADDRIPYVSAAGLVSPALTWETVVSKNLGLDFSVFRNRLDVSFDAYVRETKDMLMSVTYPSILGAAAPQENAADLRTKGWELALTWRDDVGKDWRYDFTLAVSDWSSTITKFNNPSGALSGHYVGKKIGEIWGYRTVGIFQTEEEVAAAADQSRLGSNWRPGDIQYADLDNNGFISPGNNTLANPGDREIIGNETPRYSFGINAGVSFRDFSLTAFFQGIWSRDHYPSYGRWTWFFPFNAGHVERYFITDSWSETNRDAYFPAATYNPAKNIQPQTRFLQQAGYIRLKNINLTYDLPKNLVSSIGLGNVQVFFTGMNLWEFSKIRKPLDPETIYGGSIEYPMQRIFSVGASVSF